MYDIPTYEHEVWPVRRDRSGDSSSSDEEDEDEEDEQVPSNEIPIGLRHETVAATPETSCGNEQPSSGTLDELTLEEVTISSAAREDSTAGVLEGGPVGLT